MATDAERNRAFRKERKKRARALPRIQSETAAEIGRLLRRTERELRAELAGDASEFTRFLNPQLRRSVRSAIELLGTDAGAALVTGAESAWEAGVALVDAPVDAALALEAPGFRIASQLASVDLRQLGAMRTFLTAKMTEVSVQAVNRVNTQIGLVATGAQTPGDAVTAMAKTLKSARGRAITVLRTELGRAYSTAAQERYAQASRRLPGLKKQWRRSGKLHSRIEHDAADGQVRDVDQPFNVGGVELMYPRDPAAPASETINCGCQSLPYMASWAERGALANPGRRPFTDDEIAARPMRAELDPPAPREVRERAGDGGPVVVRGADPQPELAIVPSIGDIEAAPAQVARRAIRRDLGSDDFLRFAAGSGAGERGVALIGRTRAKALGLEGRSHAVRLSAQTVRTHPRFAEFTASDWRRVQRLVDRGNVVRSRPRHRLVWTEENDRAWVAVLKETEAREQYLVSYRRANRRETNKLKG